MMTEVKHRSIETNGIRMHVAEMGAGPLVVLCHGFPESWYSWRHQMPALAEAGFHVLAPDMRGYGQTDCPPEIEQYTLLHLVGDMVGLLDALERVEQADHVADQVEERVLLDLRRAVGLAIATHVGRKHMETGFGEGRHLVAPRVPGLGKTVTKNDQRTGAHLGNVHSNTVRLDTSMLYFGHHGSLLKVVLGLLHHRSN